MNVSLKTFIPITLASALTLTACDSDVKSLAHQYCVENNKTAKEYRDIATTMGSDKQISKLDSMAYLDIFKGTKLAKDSAKVAEFNQIASSYRNQIVDRKATLAFQEKKAISSSMSLKDYNEMCKSHNHAWRQHNLDNFAYQKFFQENGILDKNIKKRCDEYSNIVSSTLKNI